jgi:arabinogalactan oligomer/maltooligosaccharide transport system permease protein
MAIETTAVRTATPARRAGARTRAALAVGRRGRRRTGASAALHAGLLLASFVAVFPIVWVLVTSFKPLSDVYNTKIVSHFTVANYGAIVHSEFPRWFLNSVIVAGLTMLVGVFLAATSGYAMSRFNFPGKRSLMWTFLVTQMFPMAILIVPIYRIMSDLQLLDTYGSLVLAYSTIAVPFCAYMLKGYFDTIPMEIDEAGRVDGLTPFGTFWRLALPLARPGLAVTAFYTFLTAWGEVAYASKFMVSPQNYTLAFGMQTYVGQFNQNWHLLAAASVLVTVPAMLVFYVVQRWLVAGLTAGGTKG